jgi:DNA-binding NarL/FixJ family response regulator
MIRVLLADDHPLLRRGLTSALERSTEIEVVAEADDFPSLRAAADRLSWDVVVMDVRMPGGAALDELRRMRSRWPDRAVLVISAHPAAELALRFIKAGASGFVPKVTAGDHVVDAVRVAASGGTWTDAHATDLLAAELRGERRADPHERLSDREYEVLCALASGRSITEVARGLHLSPKTVSTYRRRILDKLGLDTTAGLIRYAVERELV